MTVFEGKRISELPAAAAALGTMELPVNAAGAPQKLTVAQILASAQPLDSDLTAIAALTTTAYGRAFLAMSGAPDLTALTSGSTLPNPATYGNFRPYFYTKAGVNESVHYDGTRWLGPKQYWKTSTWGSYTAAGFTGQTWALGRGSASDIYVVQVDTSFNPTGTNDGANYWSAFLRKDTSGTSLGYFLGTQGLSPGVWAKLPPVAIGVLMGTTDMSLVLVLTATGVPGPLYLQVSIEYRPVYT